MTGISYARARWLDTRTGHWLSEDPLFDIDSPNLYSFVAWQPTMATDPLGLCKGEPGDPEECVSWWFYFPPGVATEAQENLEAAARNPELGRLSRALYGAQPWILGLGTPAEEDARHLLNLPHHLYDRWRRDKAQQERTRELQAELGCTFCVGEDFGIIHDTLVAEGLMDEEVLGPGVAAFPIGPGRFGARFRRGALQFTEPGGRKLAQQIARFRAAGGTGGRAEFMKHATDLAARAREAGSFVTGTVGRGPQAIPNATIFREGRTFLVVDEAGVIRSFVPNASPGGIVDEFVRLGGSL